VRPTRASVTAQLQDAIELLTDPSYRLRTERSMAQMQSSAILAELQARGANPPAARVLVRKALVELRGEYRGSPRPTTPHGGTLHSRLQWMDDFWVPAATLRAP
jgi:hypothetical protein